jgi:hypothetical protein
MIQDNLEGTLEGKLRNIQVSSKRRVYSFINLSDFRDQVKEEAQTRPPQNLQTL